MPTIAPVALSDIALSSSTPHAIGVSAGPGAVPLYDGNFAWDPVAKQHTLKGQASGSGGDRFNVQTASAVDMVKVDNGGVLWHYPASGANATAIQINTLNPPYTIGCVSISNGTGKGENFVVSEGHNVLGSGQAIDPTRGYARRAIEGHWWNSGANGGLGDYQFEWHWACSFPDLGGTEIRPLTASVTWGTTGGGHKSGLAITGSLLSLQDEQSFEHIDYSWDGTTQVFRLIWNGTALTPADVWKVESTVTTDALNFGRATQASTISYSSSGNVDQKFFTGTGLTATHRHGATFFERFFGPTNTLHEFLQYTTVPTQWLAQDVAVGGIAGLFFGAGKVDIQSNDNRPSLVCRQFSTSQTSYIVAITDPSGAIIGGIGPKGGMQPATLADANGANGMIWWSSDTPNALKCRTPAGTLKTITLA